MLKFYPIFPNVALPGLHCPPPLRGRPAAQFMGTPVALKENIVFQVFLVINEGILNFLGKKHICMYIYIYGNYI